MYLLSRVWCNGSTAAFQASGEGSSPFARMTNFPTNLIIKSIYSGSGATFSGVNKEQLLQFEIHECVTRERIRRASKRWAGEYG